MKKIISVCLGVLVVSAALGADFTRKYYSEDNSPALRIKNGYTGNITLAVTNATLGNVDVSDGTTTSNIVVTSATTMSTLANYIAAYTNAAGKKLLTVDIECSVSSDTVSNKMMQVTSTNKPAAWSTGLRWDTSACLFYSTYFPSGADGGDGNAKVLDSVWGDITGTGNITLNIYADDTEIYQKVYVSPVYVWAAITGTTNLNTADSIGPGQILEKLSIPFGGDENVLIRATRATTATTGGIGAGMLLK